MTNQEWYLAQAVIFFNNISGRSYHNRKQMWYCLILWAEEREKGIAP